MSNLKKYRLSKHYTQEQVAQKVGITTTGYQNYERGTREPSVRTAIRIAQTLDTTTESIWGRQPLDTPI